LVVDANIVIAALLRDSTTRKLITVGGLDLHAPAYLFDEVHAHSDELCERTGLSAPGLTEALRILRTYVEEHPRGDYEGLLDRALQILRNTDPRDAPHVALALAIGADGLWTEDRALGDLLGIRTYRTHELVR